MTLGMLKNYFLKVGNSYYTSKELKRDLSGSSDKEFFGISRFGIGFLSCFLCGVEAEVSTLYFDDNKSRGEYEFGIGDRNGYGLRMHITGLSGYYTLRSQANNHIINSSLPAPEFIDSVGNPNLEYNGYRSKAGTSIVIKLDPGKLGAIDLKASTEKYIYGTRMPIFFNGKRIGSTYSEIMDAAHQYNGQNIYEFTDEEKKEFDKMFPNIKGEYPKIVITVVPLDMKEYQVIPNLSGVIVKYDVLIDNSLQWQAKDQTYTISASYPVFSETKCLNICTKNVKELDMFDIPSSPLLCEGNKNILKLTLDKFTKCPASIEELGDAWLPLAKGCDIADFWQTIVDESQNAIMHGDLNNRFNINLKALINNRPCFDVACYYQGIFTDNLTLDGVDNLFDVTFLLENELRPIVDIGRTKVSALPPEALLAICGIIYHPDFDFSMNLDYELLENIICLTLPEWRCLYDSELGRWLLETQKKHIFQIQEFLQTPLDYYKTYNGGKKYSLEFTGYGNVGLKIIYKFMSAYFQDIYDMKIFYEAGQSIVFTEKKNPEIDHSLDYFPPMMFCKAGSDISRRYLCCRLRDWRRGITSDHPFAQWLIENAIKIKSHFPRQFQQIVNSLCNDDAPEIIKTVNEFRQQITKLNVCYGIDLAELHELTEKDFWNPLS